MSPIPSPPPLLLARFGMRWFVLGLALVTAASAAAVNEDESKVAPYLLPDPLRLEDGRAVTNATMWQQERRPELLRLFQEHVFGTLLPRPAKVRFVLLREDLAAVGGRAVRRDIRMDVLQPLSGPALDFTLLLPRSAPAPVPVFVGLHLFDTAATEPRIAVARRLPGHANVSPQSNQTVGYQTLVQLLNRGSGIASLNLGFLAPDSATNYRTGAARLVGTPIDRPATPQESGALGIWAWGLSRAVDYLESVPEVDDQRLAVIGHSRMGKAALWAAANDSRFTLVIANNSGCGGAALHKRNFGETVEIITRAFPYWFAGNFQQYAGHEERLPVDQHQLIALLAPRPVYVGSAVEDRWADPRGEFLALVHAEPVYQLLGVTGLGVTALPAPDHPVGLTLGYHYRTGQHDLTDYDWEQYLNFAERHWPSRK